MAAMGRPPLSYQWLHDGSPVGTDSSTLTLGSTVVGDAGQYRVVVTNVTGAVTSSVAALTVVGGPITGNLVTRINLPEIPADVALANGLAFVAGFSLVFVALGAVMFLTRHVDWAAEDAPAA